MLNSKIQLEVAVDSPKGIMMTSSSKNYREGAWLLSLWYVPHLKKNFLDLSVSEKENEETTWSTLSKEVSNFFNNLEF